MAVVSLMVVPPTSYAQVRPQVREAAPAGTDWNAPRTPWGAPDLQGIWDYRTATPLERPAEFASKETLTEEEAAAYEEQYRADLADYDLAPSVHAKWWLDYGTELTADNRTSLVIEPSDGRVPATTAEAKVSARTRSERRARTHAVSDRSHGERCITFGVPRLPGAYNSHYQIYQTPTHVSIVQ